MECPLCKKTDSFFFAKRAGHTYYECLNCKLLYMRPFPSARKTASYYENEFTYSLNVKDSQRLEKRAKHVMKKVRALCPNATTLLDIGAGQGHLMLEARKQKYEVEGIEPSQRLYNRLKKIFGKKITLADWRTFRKKNRKKYDVVTLSHVIEHVASPTDLIKEIGEILNPKGVLYIETPNYDSHLARTERENYTFLSPPQHLWILSANSLHQILQISLKKRLFTILHTETFSYSEHFAGILKIVLKGQKPIYHLSPINAKKTARKNKPKAHLSVKSLLLDEILSPLLHPLLNFSNKGSIIAIYLQKV